MRSFFCFAAALAVPAALVACTGQLVNGGGSGAHPTGGGNTTGNGGSGSVASVAAGTGGARVAATSSTTGSGAGASGAGGQGTGATGGSGTGGNAGGSGTGGAGAGGAGTGAVGTGGTGTGGGAPATCPPVTQNCPQEPPPAGCPCPQGGDCAYECPGSIMVDQYFAYCQPDGRWKLDAVCPLTPPCVCNPGEVCLGTSGSFADMFYQCVPDPCAPDPLSCNCGGKAVCGSFPNVCTKAADGILVCESP